MNGLKTFLLLIIVTFYWNSFYAQSANNKRVRSREISTKNVEISKDSTQIQSLDNLKKVAKKQKKKDTFAGFHRREARRIPTTLVNRLDKIVILSPKQKEKIAKIEQTAEEQHRELFAGKTKLTEDLKPKIEAIEDQEYEAVNKILTVRQRHKMAVFLLRKTVHSRR